MLLLLPSGMVIVCGILVGSHSMVVCDLLLLLPRLVRIVQVMAVANVDRRESVGV